MALLSLFSSSSSSEPISPVPDVPGGPFPESSDAFPDPPTPPVTTPSGTHVDLPPQHPAVTGAGAGIGAPRETTAEPVQHEPVVHTSSDAPTVRPSDPEPKPAPPMPVPEPAPSEPTSKPPVIVRPDDPVSEESHPAPSRPVHNRRSLDALVPRRSILRNTSVRSRANGPSAPSRGHTRAASESVSTTGGAPSIRGSLRTSNTATMSTFASGAVTVQPFVDPALADAVHERSAAVASQLTAKDRSKIAKDERAHNRMLQRVIRNEARAESAALEGALHELSAIQTFQKSAVRDEADAHTAYSRALAAEHEAERALYVARRKHERAMAERRAAEDALEAGQARAQETTELLREKAEAVEALRMQKRADDQERVVRVRELGQKRMSVGRFFGMG